jgi:hypothetical protein
LGALVQGLESSSSSAETADLEELVAV